MIKSDAETDLLKIDVDDFGGIAADFGIRAMPTVLFVKDGVGMKTLQKYPVLRNQFFGNIFPQKIINTRKSLFHKF